MKLTLVFLAIVALCACAVSASSAPLSSHHIVKEEQASQLRGSAGMRDGLPLGWRQLHRASPTQELELTILIAQQNVDQLTETLTAVSDPSSPRYGKHLSFAEVNTLTAPRPQHQRDVLAWLKSHSIEVSKRTMKHTPNRDMLSVRMTVAQAEALLQTQYYEFLHTPSKTQVVRALQYKVPENIAEAIDTIGPTVRFPSMHSVMNAQKLKREVQEKKHAAKHGKKHAVKKAAKKVAHHAVRKHANKHAKVTPQPYDLCETFNGTTPACLRELYAVGSYVATAGTKSNLAVTGYLEQYIAPSDLELFFQTFDPTHIRNATIVGPNDPTNPGQEASLDIQFSLATGPGIPGTFWYTAGRQPNNTDNEPFLVFLMAMASDANAPWVISTSYGDDEDTVNFNYASRMNIEFAKLGARGISVMFSSGDGGVSGGQSQQCTTFIPTYPSSSPYITSVGGTTGFGPETAVSFSSGGFSNYWTIPDYQAPAVNAYLTNYGIPLPPANLYNSTGNARGFPDVSAQATNFPVFVSGFINPTDGTSCSTPSLSGIIALLNDKRFAAGKSSLGFLNPLFYKNPQMFTDITSGSNPGCNTNGFNSTQGWDPVTGLGTPLFDQMSKVVLSLQ